MLLFVSRASLASDHCNREINYALDRNARIVPVLLDDAPLTSDLRLGLTRVQMIRRADHKADGLRDVLLRALAGRSGPAAGLPAGRSRAWLAAALVFALLIGGVAVGLLNRSVESGRDAAGMSDPGPAAAKPATAAEGPRTIAVLPFANLGTDPEQAFLADGIAEELLDRLSRNPGLRVTSRTSAFSFRDRSVDLRTIAAALGVAHVLEGSVRRAGNTVRITTQLIDVATDAHLWSQTYERRLGDIFALQDEIAQRVATQLDVHLLGKQSVHQSVNPVAYEKYLQARYLLNSSDPTQRERAGILLDEALAIQPDYVRALTELARFHPDAKGDQALERALAVDPDDAVAIAYSSWRLRGTDMAGAARLMTRALANDPANVEVLKVGMVIALDLGRLIDALHIGRYVTGLDPLCGICQSNLANALYLAGHNTEAAERTRAAMLLMPGAPRWGLLLGLVLLEAGEPEQALAAFESDQPDPYLEGGKALALLALGRTADAELVAARLGGELGEGAPLARAAVSAALARHDEAFASLDRLTIPLRGPESHVWLQPLLRPLHDDPRWQQLLERLNATPELLAAVEFSYTLPE